MKAIDFLASVRPVPWARYVALLMLVVWAFVFIGLWSLLELRMDDIRREHALVEALSTRRSALEAELKNAQTDLARSADRSRAAQAMASSRQSMIQLFDDVRRRLVPGTRIHHIRYGTTDGLIVDFTTPSISAAADLIDRIQDLPPYLSPPAFRQIRREGNDGGYRFELQWSVPSADSATGAHSPQTHGSEDRENNAPVNPAGDSL